MAACIDNCSANSAINQFCSEPNQTQITNSRCRFAKLCKLNPSSSDVTSRKSLNWIHDNDFVWLKIRQEAVADVQQEPILKDYYCATILSHASFESALANLLADKLSGPSLSKNTLLEIFFSAMTEDGAAIGAVARRDVRGARERDPACLGHAHAFLNFKGFQAIQAHRVAHKLWGRNRTALAVLIQSRVSEVFGVDIHPGAKVGSGLVIDHATGVVIGETAVVGDNVTILHNVTLGGTGKVTGDRHPKIGDGAFIGAGSKVLGSIRIGEGARVGAGSVVLKEVPGNATAVGNPARVIGG